MIIISELVESILDPFFHSKSPCSTGIAFRVTFFPSQKLIVPAVIIIFGDSGFFGFLVEVKSCLSEQPLRPNTVTS